MLMRRILPGLALLLLAVPITFAQTYGAVLTGSQEVPPRAVPGFGNATVMFDATRENVAVTITVSDLGAPINNFHIHEAPAGSNGPVVIDLIGLGGTFSNGTMTGTFPVAPAVAQRMLQNPRNFYVNVHTTQFPPGAVRGQLTDVTGGVLRYAAELRPQNEFPAVTSDAYGSALVSLDLANNTIAWEVQTAGIVEPRMAHIHRGAAGANGPVIVNFATAPEQIAGGHTHGSAAISAVQSANLTATDLTNLAAAPTAAGYYVNVHSAAFPGGEVRGQLVPANEFDIAVAGRVRGRNQLFVTDMRVFNPSYTSPAAALVEYFQLGEAANANATASTVISVPARGTSVLDDVVGTRLDADGSIGAIRVTSAMPVNVTSRIYDDQREAGNGTVGQFVPAFNVSNALRRGVLPHLSNQSDRSSGFRTNVGFFNPTATAVTVRMELRNAAGALVSQSTHDFAAQTQRQNSIGAFFPDANLDAAANLTLSFDASGPVFGYAAVNDNVSGDSILVWAQPDAGVAASQ
jgi:hypothetical protein